jgi:protein-disulfide isomerase
MQRVFFTILACAALAACTSNPPAASGGSSAPCVGGGELGGGQSADSAVASIGDQKITLAELDKEAAAALSKARTDLYNARKAALDKLIDDQLLEAEAEKRGVSGEDLLKTEVEDKAGEVTDEEARAFFESRPTGNRTYEELADRIKAYLVRQKSDETRKAFIDGLRSQANVSVLLEPVRTQVPIEGQPFKGGDAAKVTVIEFSDFQCPYCDRGKAILDDLSSMYGDAVKIVFMDFPLPIHPDAPKAHEAAACAGDQGKFWEMHDKLFENQRALKPEDLKKYAGELSLDQAKFDECLDTDAKKAGVDADLDVGKSVGVQGTPGFFVNGRFINGAQPTENFVTIIDEELQRAGIDPASVKKG